ncbi:hypothetical protein GLAREA_07114 [Glarea lozoyensis ATCC 20868]|uniref:RNase MRP protein 1 RNA binding domain-containing protein n=1 Tax=Glarea lozoyensis (strain ATCC 20868 / MF5171) TaxID=1116229 RepID=S3DPV5_GLAL2|nr:uncharacterized protein GLAREA_07114 [Glarea lozoyensis ATCC 20868]EPE34101.1 hypothetical protein GLAREA_07114 [Glarea lozoyensis ATCC 20868]
MSPKPNVQTPSLPQFSSSAVHTLTTIHNHLHLLHHRNKNQHRLSKWYKPFSIFRRQIPKLIAELERYEGARAIRETSSFTRQAREEVRRRVEFLGVLRGGWFLAFSKLVADSQFSALGLMLLGCLARFWSVLRKIGGDVGVVFDGEDEGHVLGEGLGEVAVKGDEVGEVVVREKPGDELGERVERVRFVEDEGLGSLPKKSVKRKEKAKGTDELAKSGPWLEKGLIEKSEDVEDMAINRPPKKSSEKKRLKEVSEDITQAKSENRPKKKKKKKDAFDDLFGSLI